jgi:hypothetical protein
LKQEIQNVEDVVEIEPMEPEELMDWLNNNLPYLIGEEQKAVGTMAMMISDYTEFFYLNDHLHDLLIEFITTKYSENELH